MNIRPSIRSIAGLGPYANRFAQSSSLGLYFRKHAENPVDWWPWCDEALAQAQRDNKPIFLSIGYASCHWCTVMEGEAFSYPEIAQYLNTHFLPIEGGPRRASRYGQYLYAGLADDCWARGKMPITLPLLTLLSPKRVIFMLGSTAELFNVLSEAQLSELRAALTVSDAGKNFEGGNVLQRRDSLAMEASFDQVLKSALIQQHQQVDGQLYRFNYVGKPTVTAQSEEYAFLIKALLDIKQVCLRFENLGSQAADGLRVAISLQSQFAQALGAPEEGGYLNARSEQLIV